MLFPVTVLSTTEKLLIIKVVKCLCRLIKFRQYFMSKINK